MVGSDAKEARAKILEEYQRKLLQASTSGRSSMPAGTRTTDSTRPSSTAQPSTDGETIETDMDESSGDDFHDASTGSGDPFSDFAMMTPAGVEESSLARKKGVGFQQAIVESADTDVDCKPLSDLYPHSATLHF